jgi:hypothetical protein
VRFLLVQVSTFLKKYAGKAAAAQENVNELVDVRTTSKAVRTTESLCSPSLYRLYLSFSMWFSFSFSKRPLFDQMSTHTLSPRTDPLVHTYL